MVDPSPCLGQQTDGQNATKEWRAPMTRHWDENTLGPDEANRPDRIYRSVTFFKNNWEWGVLETPNF